MVDRVSVVDQLSRSSAPGRCLFAGRLERMAESGRVGPADVDTAAAAMMRVLRPHVAADWSGPARSLEWSCWTTAAHVAHDLLAYAGQVAAQPIGAYLPFDLVIAADASPAEVL